MKNIKLIVLIVAFGLLIQVQTSFAQTVDERLKRAAAAIDKNDFDSAMIDLNEVFKLDSNNARAYDLRGIVYEAKKNYELAIADDTKAISLNPNEPRYYFNRALAYAHKPSHDYKMAFDDLTSAIKINPNNKDYYYLRGLFGDLLNLPDFGESDFTQSIKLGAITSTLYYSRAEAYRKQKKYAQYISDARKASEIDPNDLSLKDYLAKAIAQLGHTPSQIQTDKLIVGDLPKSLLANESPQMGESFSRVVKLINANDLDGAIKILNEAGKTNPNSVVGYYLAGIIFYKQGNFDQAYTNQTKAIELNPNIAEFYYIRGLAVRYDPNIWRIEDLRGTLKDFTKAIELNPNYSNAFLERSIIIYYLYQKLNVSSELNYMTELSNALSANPQNGEALYFEAITYIWYDDWKKIESNLTKAISLGTNRSEIYILRGVANYRLDNRAQALADFQKAQELDPTDTVASENIKIFNSNSQKEFNFYSGTPSFSPSSNAWAIKMRDLSQKLTQSKNTANSWSTIEEGSSQEQLCHHLVGWYSELGNSVSLAGELLVNSRSEKEKTFFANGYNEVVKIRATAKSKLDAQQCVFH